MFFSNFLNSIKSKGKRLVNDSIYRASFNIALAQVFNTLVLLAVDILFARVLSVDDFGSWKHINLIINFLIPLSILGLAEGFKYYAAQEKDAVGTHFKNITTLILGITAILFLLVYVGGFQLISNVLNNPRLDEIKFYVPILFFLIIWNRLLWYASINQGKTRAYLFSTLIGVSALMIYFAVLTYGYYSSLIDFDFFIQFLAIGVSLGFLIRNIYLYFAFLSEGIFKQKRNLSKGVVSSYFKYGLPLYLTSFIALITLNVDKTVVSYFGGVEAFAVFSIGAREIPLIGILSASLAQSQFPKIVELIKGGNTDKAKLLWLDSTKNVSMILYPLILLFMLFSKPLILLLFGEKYLEGLPIFRAYLLVLFWRNNYYGAMLSAAGKTIWITTYSAITMVVNIILSAVFYFSFGIVGVVYATFCAVTVANILQLYHENMLFSFVKMCFLKPLLFLCTVLTFITYIAFEFFGW